MHDRRTCLPFSRPPGAAGREGGGANAEGGWWDRVTWPPIDPSRRIERRRQRSWLTRRWRPLVTRPRTPPGGPRPALICIQLCREASFAYSWRRRQSMAPLSLSSFVIVIVDVACQSSATHACVDRRQLMIMASSVSYHGYYQLFSFARYVIFLVFEHLYSSQVVAKNKNEKKIQKTNILFLVFSLSASLYFSKRGAYWDRLCRDVVGRWSLAGCHARALWPNGAS